MRRRRSLRDPAGAQQVDGVGKTNVKFAQREAVVTFDNAKTSVQELTLATTNAGYPSTLKE